MTNQLENYLESLARETNFRAIKTLKSSPQETTELVEFVGAQGSVMGPFVRKTISNAQGLGKTYLKLASARKQGIRLLHTPAIYDAYEREDALVVIMEQAPGQTLQDYIYAQNPGPQVFNRWFGLLCDAVTELHTTFDAPIIHRDLKPSNIMVAQNTTSDTLFIIDFGIARQFSPTQTADTTCFGTRAYAPPEQFGFGQTDVRSDIYSLGMVAYYMLTEETPDPQTMFTSAKSASLPPAIKQFITRACAFDPNARFQSAAEMKAAFLDLAHARPAHTPSQNAECAPATLNPAHNTRARSNNTTPPDNTPASFFQKFTLKLEGGKTISIRNIILLVFWAFFMLVGISVFTRQDIDISPENLTQYKIDYFMFTLLFFTGCAFGLSNKRSLATWIPALGSMKRTWRIAITCALIIASIVFAILCPQA
jgi:serine/threonine protein kinase